MDLVYSEGFDQTHRIFPASHRNFGARSCKEPRFGRFRHFPYKSREGSQGGIGGSCEKTMGVLPANLVQRSGKETPQKPYKALPGGLKI